MLMIGTNNSNGTDNTAEEIADGITAIVQEIRKRSPATKVLLLGIFPRGAKPNPQRDKLKQVNTLIAKLDDGQHVKYLDIGGELMEKDGTISKEIMPDYLHLSEKGYQIWADAVKGPILELLGKK
jgi:lysophospholipase L1-like esterase